MRPSLETLQHREYRATKASASSPAGRSDPSMSLLPLFLRPAAWFLAALVAGRAAEATAAVLHRAGALPRNRGLERLVRDDDLLDGHGGGVCIARLAAGVTRCLGTL